MNPYPNSVVMSYGLGLNADPDILPAFSPVSWEKITDSGMTYDRDCEVVIDLPGRRIGTDEVFSKTSFMNVADAVIPSMWITGRMFDGFSSLCPINHGQTRKDSLPYGVSSRPFPKGKGRKKQQENQKSHHWMVIH